MEIRHFVIACIVAGASAAHAGPIASVPTHFVGGWTLAPGSVSVVGRLDSIEEMLASGNFEALAQAWNMHTSFAANGGGGVMLFSPVSHRHFTPVVPSSHASKPRGGPADGAETGGSTGGGGTGETGANQPGEGNPNGDPGADFPLPDAGAIDVGAPGQILPREEPGSATVPEPESAALLLVGLAGLLAARRKR